MSVTDNLSSKKAELGKELVIMDKASKEMEERGGGNVGEKEDINVRKERSMEGNEYCKEQRRKTISGKEVGGIDLSDLSRNEGESQKIKDRILGEAEGEVMEIENVTKQVKQGRVGLKVLDNNRMVGGGKEQIGICTRTERRRKRVCRKSQERKGPNNEGNMENEVMKGNKRFMPIDEEEKGEMSDQQGKKARAVYV